MALASRYSSEMDISFVILTWNSASYVRSCLSSISRALPDTLTEYEVLVFDNGSRDGTRAELAGLSGQFGDRLKIHYSNTNLGTTKSRNELLRRSTGRYICVMDSDVELDPGTFAPLLRQLELDPGIGIIVPRIHYPSGRWQKSTDGFPTLIGKIDRFIRLRQIEKRQGEDVGRIGRAESVDYAISAFWLMPRRVLETVGMLDEKIFYAPEDVDYCLRVWKAGYRILYMPSVSIIHHTQEISRGLKFNKAKVEHVKGLVYYFMKHGYLWRKPTFPAPAHGG